MIDFWESLLRTLSALAIVLVLMGLVAIAARRLMNHRLGQAGGHQLIRVVASGHIAPRKTIALVSVAGEYLIVGATATDLVPLGRVSDSTRVEELLASAAPGAFASTAAFPQSAFTSWLHSLSAHVVPRDKEHHGGL
ncbi:MAG: flagellar biosynthetic protein FliO [Nitrospira sp.]|nr:flagellar biosynthetic protein FliO [Nitrospira sp.]MBH0182616.1 flagellar biosynthetic protein FliO [Nitrospira sp.]MBH0186607.1 flagellar biosynthetic protein FliO [Nitrospira sp.]MBH0197648.1 flagellar biosynthetic protein FliO [Nitrospira sp.]